VGIGAPPAGAPHCCGASRGWLALTDNACSPTRLVLWDPASGAEVRLPLLPGVTQVFLSADPLASPDWTAVAGQRYGYLGAQKSFFCRPGDAAWSVLCDRPTAGIDSVAFHEGEDLLVGLAASPRRLRPQPWACATRPDQQHLGPHEPALQLRQLP